MRVQSDAENGLLVGVLAHVVGPDPGKWTRRGVRPTTERQRQELLFANYAKLTND
nr:hypothetical protein CE91St29_25750 [Corynebacterium striatum]